MSPKEIISALLKTPLWIIGFGAIMSFAVFSLPSLLPKPDPALKVNNIVFVSSEKSSSPNTEREHRRVVQLPHDWRKHDLNIEHGWYEFTVSFSENSNPPMALYMAHVQQTVDVWIDDLALTNIIPEYVVSGRFWNRPIFLNLPETALGKGEHKFIIYLHSAPAKNALLDEVYVGPRNQLRPSWEWHYHYRFTLVAVITFGMLFLSLFVAALWLLRKKETMYGWFALCTTFWSLHNIPHIIDKPSGISSLIWDAQYFSLLGWMVVTLVIFNHRYVGNKHPRIERNFLIYATAGSLPLFFLSHENLHIYTYMFWDLSLLLIGAYAVLYVLIAYNKRPTIEIRLLVIVGIIILAFGLNDYLVISSLGDRTRGLLIQFSGLPAMLVLIWFLLSRFVRVLKESETLNQELEQRVLMKEKELEKNFEQLKKMEQEQLLAEERERIMQDVHDGVGGQLVAMLAEIESGNATTENVSSALSQSLTDLRLVIDSLDTASEDLPTLLGMLRTRLQPRLDGHNIQLHWKVTPLPVLEDFGPRKALQLMRILQEAIINVLKHSGASNLYIKTESSSNTNDTHSITIEIRDDGCWVEPKEHTGYGLKNIRRRANSIGADIEISGNIQGTVVKIVLTGKERLQSQDQY